MTEALESGSVRNGPTVEQIRRDMRARWDTKAPQLEAIADGEPVQTVEYDAYKLAPFSKCSVCGCPMDAPKVDEILGLPIRIQVEVSATVKERLAAFDMLLRFGVGTLKEVSTESVRERVAATLAVIRTECPQDVAERIITALRPVWTQ